MMGVILEQARQGQDRSELLTDARRSMKPGRVGFDSRIQPLQAQAFSVMLNSCSMRRKNIWRRHQMPEAGNEDEDQEKDANCDQSRPL